MSEFSIELGAEQDFLAALRWYAEQSQGAGEAFAKAVDVAFDEIASAPSRWPAFDGVFRYRIVNRFPYLIVYRIRDASVIVVAVAHSSRDVYWHER